MKKKSSILERARTVLKTTGTLGAASAGQFVDNFCDEVERKAYTADTRPAEVNENSDHELDESEEEEREK